jgi:addiction module HigA family antidote
MTRKKPIIHHPGKILREEFLIPAQITPQQLANIIGISNKEMNQIINEKKDLNKEIAAALAVYFSTAPTF